MKNKTKIWDGNKPLTEEQLEQIVKTIKEDGIIIFPTDTVYGIACNPFSENAINKLFEIKNRKKTNPIGVLTDSVEKIKMVAEINQKEKELIETYLPGALTIILKKKENIPNLLTANLNTIGVRIPDHPVALKILEKIPFPLAVTSANESGDKEGINLHEIQPFFEGKVEVMIDGGFTPIQVASTIVRVEGGEIKVLREGSIKM